MNVATDRLKRLGGERWREWRDEPSETPVDRVANRECRTLLRDALGSEPPADLDRDLWPRMRDRLARGPASPSTCDWALVAAMAGAIIAFPRIVIGILYHL